MCLFLFSTCFGLYVFIIHSTLHTRQSSIQNNKYKVSHKYSYFSWRWAHNRPKLVEKRNKHTKKKCAPSWLFLQVYPRLWCRSQRWWVWIPPGACCVLSGSGLCDELITRPEESYRMWCVVVCDLETPRMRRPWPALGRSATAKKKEALVLE